MIHPDKTQNIIIYLGKKGVIDFNGKLSNVIILAIMFLLV